LEEEEVECRICHKQTIDKDYCLLHKKAHQNLTEKFEEWRKALDISWKDYLREIMKNPATGIRAREVAETLLAEEH
jgi:hypothetical protein